MFSVFKDYADQVTIDGHNDWPHLIRGFYDNMIDHASFDQDKSLVGQVDLQRLRDGQVGGVFLSAYVDWYWHCSTTQYTNSLAKHQQSENQRRIHHEFTSSCTSRDHAAD
jgi:hypothetical protein